MRALSFLLALALVLAAPALQVSLEVSAAQDHLPGVGTFSYSGSR